MIGQGASGVWKRFMAAAEEIGGVILGDRVEAKLDHDIRAIDLEIKRAMDAEQAAKARRVDAQAKADNAKQQQREIEATIAKLIRGRRKTQAMSKASEAARLAGDVLEWSEQAGRAGVEQEQMALVVEELQRRLALLKHQMGSLKAAANLQRAQHALMRAKGENPDTARDAVERLRKGKENEAQDEPASDVPRPETADEIIARIQKKERHKSSKTTSKSRRVK